MAKKWGRHPENAALDAQTDACLNAAQSAIARGDGEGYTRASRALGRVDPALRDELDTRVINSGLNRIYRRSQGDYDY